MSIKAKVNEYKKELLLQEATLMFETSGFNEMKISDLAKKTKVSIGTIYSLFESKEGLYMAYIQSSIESFFSDLNKRIGSESNAVEKIKIFLRLKFEHLYLKRYMLATSVQNNPLFFHTINNEFAYSLEPIYLFLAQCFMELNPRIDDETAMEIALAFNGFSDGFMTKSFQTNQELRLKVDEISEMYIFMVTQYKIFL
jgi:AcrR family transcriptional regulator